MTTFALNTAQRIPEDTRARLALVEARIRALLWLWQQDKYTKTYGSSVGWKRAYMASVNEAIRLGNKLGGA